MPLNYAKTAMLLAALMAIFVAMGAVIGGQSGMVIAFVIALAMNVFSFFARMLSNCALPMNVPSNALTGR